MYPSHHYLRVDCIVVLLGALLVPAGAFAADAHQAVKAQPGDIVLLRNVSTRPAYRPAPPGMALMVDPSPRREIAGALGTGELSDADYASLDAATPATAGGHRSSVEQIVGSALGSTLAGNDGHAGASDAGIGNVIAGPLGAVGNTTRGIGDQVRGALSQLPGMTPATPAAH
ncbi:hypothetical protein [Rhodanobacter ginsengiterrae]|uniref:hypothetical protein n=1 Tax=Rhodanobacter ginsengiterrae TaxID=2008451 RepID=UPI003CE681CC